MYKATWETIFQPNMYMFSIIEVFVFPPVHLYATSYELKTKVFILNCQTINKVIGIRLIFNL